ncbi:MAG: ferrochelatase [Planctomycetota bacterium]|jgi:ferrochelatase
MDGRIGVFLLNLGGPYSLDAVQPFLKRLFSDRSIIKISPFPPLQRLLAGIISRRRARKVRPRYEAIGGKSPIGAITAAQAEALEKVLREKGINCRVYTAMRYSSPTTEEVLQKAASEGVKRIVALPLYPQYSHVTSGSHLTELKKVIRKHSPDMELTIVNDYYDDEAYLNALTETVREAIDSLPVEVRDNAQILFSAHSIPQSVADSGDPYIRQTAETVSGVVERLGVPENRWSLAYQSRSGPVKWVRPETEVVLRAVAAGGGRGIVMVPVSFVSDHVETLWEMDIHFKGIAEKCDAVFVRASALNTRPDLIKALSGIVLSALGESN